MKTHLEGLIAAPFTPMKDDGAMDLDKIGPYADLLSKSGVQGAFVAGTTGESLSLTPSERMDLARCWVEAVPKGLKVIIHVGDNCVSHAQDLARHAQKIGAYAIGAMAPCFYRPGSLDALIDYCRLVAQEAPNLPFYYYHIPSMTHVTVPMIEFLEKAADRIPSLAGAKFTHEDLMEYELCRGLGRGRFDMVLGFDELLLSALVLGAQSAIGNTYNYAAPLYVRIIRAFREGRIDEAQVLQRKSMELVRVLRSVGAFLPASKSVMGMVGLDCGPVRPPVPRISEADKAELRRRLEGIGFFEFSSKR